MKIKYSSLKLFNFFIPINLSIFLIFSVFNVPFSLKLLTFTSLIILLIIKNYSYKFYLIHFPSYYHILLFSFACLLSFLLTNDVTKLYVPNIVNILALTFLSILLVSTDDIYEKTIEYTIYLLSVILTFSIPIHFFLYDSFFLSATLFFYDFANEDYASKNTLGILLCLIFPYLILKLSKKPSFINIFIFIVLFVGIFYLFSRTALVLSVFVLTSMLFTFKKNLITTSISISIILLLSIFFFQITPEKYNSWKSLSNQQIKSDQLIDDTKSPNDVFSLSSYRSQYIFKSLNGFSEKPLFGYGFSKYQQNNKEFDKENNLIRQQVTHNDYAQILYEQGIIGFILLGFLFIINFYRLLFYVNVGSLTSIRIIQFLTLVISLNFINLLDHPIFWIFLSMNTISLSNDK